MPWGQSSDQRPDEVHSLTFTWDELEEELEIMGHARLSVRVTSSAPVAYLSAKLCDVFPDGTSSLVTRGMLNLTTRDSRERPIAAGAGHHLRHRPRAGGDVVDLRGRAPGPAGPGRERLAERVAAPRTRDAHDRPFVRHVGAAGARWTGARPRGVHRSCRRPTAGSEQLTQGAAQGRPGEGLGHLGRRTPPARARDACDARAAFGDYDATRRDVPSFRELYGGVVSGVDRRPGARLRPTSQARFELRFPEATCSSHVR